ncbi:chaperone dnaJ 6 [Chlorella sorokiniana]|uniref:Chaperone dnaJ 6 n=1 Tax=Chlorella sorokiniana TaxID=3076 RepID=A0A2P6TSX1_CHLSO|nr:chaperone dnaJ 6 [Chlorella sorokiniana]|eukprot:PRW57170.1 chaperone dnaJ 6 [Chlorella sorokiniana]
MVWDGKASLYEALGVAKDASQADIRKAYMKLALQLHPDKNPGDAGAEEKFKTLQKVYAILSDPDKRRVYDQTGSVEDSEELAGEKFNELYNYYRAMYAKVTEDDLEQFHTSFKGGEEERAELLKYYSQFKGDMAKVFEWVMCSDEAADAHRFMDILEAAVKAKEVPSFPKYTTWAKKVAAKPRPKPGAAGKKGGGKKGGKAGSSKDDGEAALIAQIRARQAGAMQRFGGGGVLGKLMARYGGGEENVPGEPSEEEFQAAAARLKARQGGSGGGKKAGGGGKQKAEATAAGGSGKRAKK